MKHWEMEEVELLKERYLDINIPLNITGMIGFIALGPAIFIFLDYITKNK